MRVWTTAGACLALASLGGCAVPTALTIASYAADGASFLSTGRSMTDHGISILLQKDCALFRVVRGKPICRPMKKDDLVYDIAFADRTYEYRDPDAYSAPPAPILMADAGRPKATAVPSMTLASLEQVRPEPSKTVPAMARATPAGPPPAQVSAQVSAQVPAQVAAQVPNPEPIQVPARNAPTPIPPPAPGYHVVAGAFDRLQQAEARRGEIVAQLSRLGHSHVGVQIARLPHGSPATYVVLTRPVVPQDANLLVGQLQLEKGESPWKLRSGRSSL